MERSIPSESVSALVMATFLLLGAQEAPNASDDCIDLLRQIADRLDAMPLNRMDEREHQIGSSVYAMSLTPATTEGVSDFVAA